MTFASSSFLECILHATCEAKDLSDSITIANTNANAVRMFALNGVVPIDGGAATASKTASADKQQPLENISNKSNVVKLSSNYNYFK